MVQQTTNRRNVHPLNAHYYGAYTGNAGFLQCRLRKH